MRSSERIGGLILFAFIIRLSVTLLSPGVEFDMISYYTIGNAVLEGVNFYVAHPTRYPYFPGWAAIEACAVKLSQVTGAPWRVLIRLPQIVADSVLAGVLVPLVDKRSVNVDPFHAGLFHVLNPVAILITAAHGQFDAVPLLAVIIAIAAVERGAFDKSALSLGLGIIFKPVPILFGPLFLGRLESWSDRIRYVVIAAAPATLASIPFLINSPMAFITAIFGYTSGPHLSWFRLLLMVSHGLDMVFGSGIGFFVSDHWNSFMRLGKYAVIGISLTLGSQYGRRQDKNSMWAVLFGFLFLFYTVSSGVAPQYLYWMMPLLWLVNIPSRLRWGFLTVATISLTGYYTVKFIIPPAMIPLPFPEQVAKNMLLAPFVGLVWGISAIGSLMFIQEWRSNNSNW